MRVRNQQLQARVPALAFAEQGRIVPDRVIVVQFFVTAAALVAPLVPPPADLGDHVCDAAFFFTRCHRRCRPGAASFGRTRNNGHGNDAPHQALEAPSPQHLQHIIRQRLQIHIDSLLRPQAKFEAAHGAPGAIAHAHEVEVQKAELEVGAGAEHALALGDGVGVCGFRGHGGETEDGGGEV